MNLAARVGRMQAGRWVCESTLCTGWKGGCSLVGFLWCWGHSNGAWPLLVTLSFPGRAFKRTLGSYILEGAWAPQVGAQVAVPGAVVASSSGQGPGMPPRPSENKVVSMWNLEVVRYFHDLFFFETQVCRFMK